MRGDVITPQESYIKQLEAEVDNLRAVMADVRAAAGLDPRDGVPLVQKVAFMKARVEELEGKKFHTGKQVFDHYNLPEPT